MSNTEEAVEILSYISIEGAENPNLEDLLSSENISFPLSVAVKYGFATLTEKGEKSMTETFEYLEQVAVDRGLLSLLEIVETDEPVPTRLHNVNILD
jgi:hypothetical protein